MYPYVCFLTFVMLLNHIQRYIINIPKAYTLFHNQCDIIENVMYLHLMALEIWEKSHLIED